METEPNPIDIFEHTRSHENIDIIQAGASSSLTINANKLIRSLK